MKRDSWQKYFEDKIVQMGVFLVPRAIIDRAMATKNAQMGDFWYEIWYARYDSNVRPSAPQADALSNWATGTYVDSTHFM